MKKSRLLALTLVVAIMLMGAGYAYWSDALQINATVTTGELEVVFSEAYTRGGDSGNPGYPGYVYHDGQKWANPSLYNFVIPTEIVDEGKTIEATLGNLYPGARGTLTAKIDNVGTIPAVIESVSVDFAGKGGTVALSTQEQELIDTLVFTAGFAIFDNDGTPLWQIHPLDYINGKDLDHPDTGLEAKLTELLVGQKLEPLQTLVIGSDDTHESMKDYMKIVFPTDADNDSSLELQEIGIKITINWKQHNQ